jgi:hypothetical protein
VKSVVRQVGYLQEVMALLQQTVEADMDIVASIYFTIIIIIIMS